MTDACDGIELDVEYDATKCDFGDDEGGGPSVGDVYYTIFNADDTELWMGTDRDTDGNRTDDDGSTSATRESNFDQHPMKKK